MFKCSPLLIDAMPLGEEPAGRDVERVYVTAAAGGLILCSAD
jgi:hypothetical protein